MEINNNNENLPEHIEEWMTGKKRRKKIVITSIIVIIIVIIASIWGYYNHLKTTPDNINAKLSLEIQVRVGNSSYPSILISYTITNLGWRPVTILYPIGRIDWAFGREVLLDPLLKVNFIDANGNKVGQIYYQDNITTGFGTIKPGLHVSDDYCSLMHWGYNYWGGPGSPTDYLSFDNRNTTPPYSISLIYDSTSSSNVYVWKGMIVSNTVVIDELPVPP